MKKLLTIASVGLLIVYMANNSMLYSDQPATGDCEYGSCVVSFPHCLESPPCDIPSGYGWGDEVVEYWICQDNKTGYCDGQGYGYCGGTSTHQCMGYHCLADWGCNCPVGLCYCTMW